MSQLEAALVERESTLKEQSAVLQNAFVTIVSNRRLLLQLQQVKSTSNISRDFNYPPLTPATRTTKHL
jgi:hypothetical protein